MRASQKLAMAALATVGLNNFAQALTFSITFTPTVDAQARNAVNFVAQEFQNSFTDPIKLFVNVNASTAGPVVDTSMNFDSPSYTSIRNALIADAKTPDDAAAISTLPASAPVSGTYRLPTAESKAIGLRVSNNPLSDGLINFNSTTLFSFDPNNRAVPGAIDFVGLMEREFSRFMGRDHGPTGSFVDPFDLFRYSSPGNLNPFWGSGVYFSLDAGTTNLKDFNDPQFGGDAMDWDSTVPGDAFNALFSTNQANVLSALDLRTMDVLGYDPVPEPTVAAAMAFSITGVLLARRRVRGQ